MFIALRGGFAAKLSAPGISNELCKILSKNNISKYQVATLTRAAHRDESEVPNIKPFPYHEKEMTILNMVFGDTWKNRMHKHNKLIVIDGQIASGKNKLAEELAKEFDFLYLPQPNFDDLLVSHWGFDVRTLDHKLPKAVQSWDIERFLMCPNDINTAAMQNYMLMMRSKRYIDALAHCLCTGQGVVTIRSPWVDTVFAKTMLKHGYISKKAFEAHTDMCDASLHYYLRPHLIIYLDVPVQNTIQNIKKRGLCHEVNSKVLNEQYLADLEENYKRDYLSKISEHSLLLIYDWTHGGDSEVVVEDIEGLNFDNYEYEDIKMSDWRFNSYEWKIRAKHYTYDSDMLLHNLDIIRTDVPEIGITGNEHEAWVRVWNEVPDSKYAPGYNVLKGDKGVMWKDKFYLGKDYVTPLMQKYYERKEREKKQMKN